MPREPHRNSAGHQAASHAARPDPPAAVHLEEATVHPSRKEDSTRRSKKLQPTASPSTPGLASTPAPKPQPPPASPATSTNATTRRGLQPRARPRALRDTAGRRPDPSPTDAGEPREDPPPPPSATGFARRRPSATARGGEGGRGGGGAARVRPPSRPGQGRREGKGRCPNRAKHTGAVFDLHRLREVSASGRIAAAGGTTRASGDEAPSREPRRGLDGRALQDSGVRSSCWGHAATPGRRCPIPARRLHRANHGGLDQEGGVRAARWPVMSAGAGEFGSVRRNGGESARWPTVGPWSRAKRTGSTPNPAQEMRWFGVGDNVKEDASS